MKYGLRFSNGLSACPTILSLSLSLSPSPSVFLSITSIFVLFLNFFPPLLACCFVLCSRSHSRSGSCSLIALPCERRSPSGICIVRCLRGPKSSETRTCSIFLFHLLSSRESIHWKGSQLEITVVLSYIYLKYTIAYRTEKMTTKLPTLALVQFKRHLVASFSLRHCVFLSEIFGRSMFRIKRGKYILTF